MADAPALIEWINQSQKLQPGDRLKEIPWEGMPAPATKSPHGTVTTNLHMELDDLTESLKEVLAIASDLSLPKALNEQATLSLTSSWRGRDPICSNSP